jgi:hypothetical protein
MQWSSFIPYKLVTKSGSKLRNNSWKPECVLSFNMGWQTLVFYPEGTFWLP